MSQHASTAARFANYQSLHVYCLGAHLCKAARQKSQQVLWGGGREVSGREGGANESMSAQIIAQSSTARPHAAAQSISRCCNHVAPCCCYSRNRQKRRQDAGRRQDSNASAQSGESKLWRPDAIIEPFETHICRQYAYGGGLP